MLPDNPGQLPDTVLVLSFDGLGAAPGVNPYSARGLRQTLDPIHAVRDQGGGGSILRYTVNGDLIDVSPHQLRKYRSEISGNDSAPPAIDGLWAGMVVQVSCIYELSYLTANGAPGRTPVPGSQRVEGDFTYYRPQLTMMIADFNADRDEWGAVTSWKLVLQET